MSIDELNINKSKLAFRGTYGCFDELRFDKLN